MKNKTKKNFLYNLIYHVFLVIVPLITTPYVSRRLGAVGLGDYGFAYSKAYYFSLFIKLGLSNYGNRAIAITRNDKREMSKEFWNIYCFQFFLSILVGGIYIGYCFLFASNRILSLYLILFVCSSGLDITWFYWGIEEFKITVTRSMIIKILTTAAIFLFVKDEGDTWLYTMILCFGSFASQIFLWPRMPKLVTFVKPTMPEIVKHIKPNLILFLPAVAVSLYKVMDKIMLGYLASTADVGYYESSEKIIKVPMAVIESLGIVMQPRMANLIKNNADKKYLQDVLKKSVIVIMLCSTVLGFGIMTMADDFVPAYYGKGFDICSTLFKILLPSCMFLGLTNVMKSQYLLPRKKDKEYVVVLFIGAGVNLTMNLIFIPSLASVGAAIGTLAAEAAVCIAIAVVAGRTMNTVKYYSVSIPFVIAGGIMYVAGYFIQFPELSFVAGFALKVVVSGCIYIVSLLVLMGVSKFILKNRFCDDVLATFSFLWKGRRTKKIKENK